LGQTLVEEALDFLREREPYSSWLAVGIMKFFGPTKNGSNKFARAVSYVLFQMRMATVGRGQFD
jgi:hypothetical protein